MNFYRNVNFFCVQKFFKKRFLFLIIFFSFLNFSFCQKVSAKKVPARIVSLGASATEILFAIGAQDKIVGCTDFCNYPEEARAIKSVGGFDGSSISLESIILLEPDFVYLFAGMHDHLIKPLESLGIKVFISNCSSIAEIENEILQVGKILNLENNSKNVVFNMEEKLKKNSNYVEKCKNEFFQKKVAEKNAREKTESEIKIFYQIWNNPIMSVGKNSFINDIILRSGCKNIFEEESSAYPIVSEEAIIFSKPDFIFFTSNDDIKKVQLVEIEKNPTNAISKKLNAKYGVYNVGQLEIFSRPTPRAVDAVEELSKIIWEKVLNEK